MKVHDGIIGAFSAFCDTIATIGYALAYQSWHFYVGEFLFSFYWWQIEIQSNLPEIIRNLYAIVQIFSCVIFMLQWVYLIYSMAQLYQSVRLLWANFTKAMNLVRCVEII